MDIKDFYIHVRTSYNSPIEKSYVGYTVLPGIAIPPLVSPPSFKCAEWHIWQLRSPNISDLSQTSTILEHRFSKQVERVHDHRQQGG